jgi:hypothetical protein
MDAGLGAGKVTTIDSLRSAFNLRPKTSATHRIYLELGLKSSVMNKCQCPTRTNVSMKFYFLDKKTLVNYCEICYESSVSGAASVGKSPSSSGPGAEDAEPPPLAAASAASALSIRPVFTSLVKQDQSPRIKLNSAVKKIKC